MGSGQLIARGDDDNEELAGDDDDRLLGRSLKTPWASLVVTCNLSGFNTAI